MHRTPSDKDQRMLRPKNNFRCALLIALLSCGGTAYAQNNIISTGIETFREACLMVDPHSERIYQWATDKGLKIVLGQGPERAGTKLLRWEVAKSDNTIVLLQAVINDPASLNCSVYFDQIRDSNRLVETFFLDEMRRKSHAIPQSLGSSPDRLAYSVLDGGNLFTYFDGRQSAQDHPHISLAVAATLSPPDTVAPRTFATPARSYQLFVSTCLERFPDIESIGERVKDSGWRSATALRTSPIYSGFWDLYDPFDEMSPYLIELKRSKSFSLCKLGYDIRAAVPMDHLIQTYALVHADDPYPNLHKPNDKFEYYSGRVAGREVSISLRTLTEGHYGELSVSIQTPQ